MTDDCDACKECEEHVNSPQELDEHDLPDYKIEAKESEDLGEEETADECGDDDYEGNGYWGNGYDGDQDCLRCDRSFSTYSRMIRHLESDACSYVTRNHLDYLAAASFHSSDFMSPYSRSVLLNGWDSEDDEHEYFCPSCEVWTERLSGLLQHVESDACELSFADYIIDDTLDYITEKI